MEKEIAKIYRQAEKEITQKWNEYMKRGEKRLSSLSEKYGTDSQEYKDALRNITLKNVWYKDMVNTTTKQLAEVNQTALAYVQDQMPEVYALNYNQFGRELEKAGISDEDSIRFNLVDEATVRRMIKDGDIEMPYQKKRLSIPKDQRWNTRQINSSVLQGIIQGESIGQIAKRLYPIMDNNVHAAVRNARTLVTGAESRGRMDSYKEAKDDGVVLNKVWLATADGRTRDWHVDMDGQEVGVDEEFTDGLGNALMYPGDPGGAPETVYNCFSAETGVAIDSDVVRTYKYEYDGELITIKTAAGVEFTCTPNHPILTRFGWIPANVLNKGDDILVTIIGDDRTFPVNPNIKHVFTRFDALHKFFDKGIRERATNLNVDFHGDIPTSDVEIVTQERFLRNDGNACGRKSVNKLFFKSSDVTLSCKSTLVKHFGRVRLSSFGFVCGKGKPLSIFGRCLRHAKKHGLRPVARGYSGLFKPEGNAGTGYAEVLGKCLDGFTGIVCADKIVDVDVVSKCCHVYNLQSENGYYFVNNIITRNNELRNNGIMAISRNCRCCLTTHIVGFQKADGSISYVDYEGEPDAHDAAMEKERDRRGLKIQPKGKTKEIKPDTEGAMRFVPKGKAETLYDAVTKTNPKYNEGREYKVNCANCAVAVELQQRGYEVQALPRDFSKKIASFWYNNKRGNGSWTDSFTTIDGASVGATRKTNIEKKIAEKMRNFGKGSRGVVFVEWDGYSSGHYFNVSNENGEIIYADGQNGETGEYVTNYFNRAKPSKTWLFRTDDKEIDEFAREVVTWNGKTD